MAGQEALSEFLRNDFHRHLEEAYREKPDPLWSIRRFAVWYLRHRPIQQSAIPIHGPVDAARPLVGVTLYRAAPFQVQLFIGLPGASTPRHSHPNVDSIEWHVAGESGFVSERNASFAGLMHIAAGEMHTAQAGATGAAFLSMQKWLNGVMPSSVELDWEADNIAGVANGKA